MSRKITHDDSQIPQQPPTWNEFINGQPTWQGKMGALDYRKAGIRIAHAQRDRPPIQKIASTNPPRVVMPRSKKGK